MLRDKMRAETAVLDHKVLEMAAFFCVGGVEADDDALPAEDDGDNWSEHSSIREVADGGGGEARGEALRFLPQGKAFPREPSIPPNIPGVGGWKGLSCGER